MRTAELPAMSRAAVAYALHQLAARAGVLGGGLAPSGLEALGVSIRYARPGDDESEQQTITVVPARPGAWSALVQRAASTIDWLAPRDLLPPGTELPLSGPIPVLFWGEGREDGTRPFAERREDGSLVFNADIVAATLFMLSRWEETTVPVRDLHDRFPATASVAYKQGFLDRPVIDEYALILRAWLQALLPRWVPKANRFAVKLSHDVDLARDSRNLYEAARRFGGDLLWRRSPRLAWETALATALQAVDPRRAVCFRGIETLARLSIEHGLDSAFYFIAAEPALLDGDYDVLSSMMRECIKRLRACGFEIGYHASYHTLDNPGRLAAEKARLDAVLGETHYGGRQHYLRFHAPDTWRHWEGAGLRYDSTLAYADHEGFRCGTCHPFRPFDIEQNRELDLWEWPLVAMDATLRDYRKLTPDQALRRILQLAQRSKQVEGTFTLLWHNSSLGREWRPWAETYRRVLPELRASLG